MERLNPLTLPLVGQSLIEASAGTGKTYTLVQLYLRLLLGLGEDAAFERPLTVTEILVVTFTEAATQELRDRIRSQIHTLRIACLRDAPEADLDLPLLAQIPDKPLAAAILLTAERQMDEASIFTIHGFCQRILTIHAFEATLPFQQTLIHDEAPLYQEAANDFWRQHFYALPAETTEMILSFWSEPLALLADVKPFFQQTALTTRADASSKASLTDTIIDLHQQQQAKIDAIQTAWRDIAPDVEALIQQSGVNKRSYSKRFLASWIEQITTWAKDSANAPIPEALVRFSQSTLHDKTPEGQVAPTHATFALIDDFYASPIDIKSVILRAAATQIQQRVTHKKQTLIQCGFDDLLTQLHAVLTQSQSGESLAESIAARYPVAMVDEFQDTDPIQYAIFRQIYYRRLGTGLILIGDPKQAIYGFRGADIFTYMQAKSEIDALYTMDTNWRSSGRVVQAVNALFEQRQAAFMFSQIPFLAVNAAKQHQDAQFLLAKKPQPALRFCLLPEAVSAQQYRHQLAAFCADEIHQWLLAGQEGKAILRKRGQDNIVTSSDIAVLVRTRDEARLVKEALLKHHIQSVYLSNRETVFDTPEAKALSWILPAVLSPENEQQLRTALASHLLGLTYRQLDDIYQNETLWDHYVAQFLDYQRCWLKRGFLPMLRMMMMQHQMAERLLADNDGERRLTDLLHLGELLQEASFEVESEQALIRWLVQRLSSDETPSESQQQRLESDQHLVKIVTIHKSKGLEYPLVWLPFACVSRRAKQALFHDRTDFSRQIALPATDDALALADEERLAEDIRLLYVAVTRAIFHCSIGMAVVKERSSTVLHHSALGYLLNQSEKSDVTTLQTHLQHVTDAAVTVIESGEPLPPWQPEMTLPPQLAAKQFTRQLRREWQVASYSYLVQQPQQALHLLPEALALTLDHPDAQTGPMPDETPAEMAPDITPEYSVYHFPKGARVGVILHTLMETWDFTQPLEAKQVDDVLIRLNLDEPWREVLHAWFAQIVATPLDQHGLALNQIQANQRLIELQFYLPVNHLVQAKAWNALAKQHDALSARCPDVGFEQFSGMLKGFIDLVFEWQGQYFVADYKSNWLGMQPQDYQAANLENAMCEHRYDLQYQIYTLALHRYLKQRLPDYDYDTHIGGVYYLFLRGMTHETPSQGVYYCKPTKAHIDALDQLFG